MDTPGFLSGFLLNSHTLSLVQKNTIVQRLSELNYIREIQSNSIGRYVLFTFKYRLNKFGDNPGGIDVEINRR